MKIVENLASFSFYPKDMNNYLGRTIRIFIPQQLSSNVKIGQMDNFPPI